MDSRWGGGLCRETSRTQECTSWGSSDCVFPLNRRASCGPKMAAPPATPPSAASPPTISTPLSSLESFLREHFPRDVLIPCVKGEKRPSRKFSDNRWTWFDYDRLSTYVVEKSDWAITLHDLCVVDVDSVEQVADLEARFPVLRTVPAVQTRKGMHYYFRRSPLADESGYLDGAAQREKGIDFKTVTSTGTGGILVVPPSPNKTWLRAPFGEGAVEITPIPDDLLTAVALPTSRSVQTFGALSRARKGPAYNPAAANARFSSFLAEFLCDPDGLLSVRLASVLAAANAGIAGGSVVSCVTAQTFQGTDLDVWVSDAHFDALCAEMPSLFLTEEVARGSPDEKAEAVLREYGAAFPVRIADSSEQLIRIRNFRTRPTPSMPQGNKVQIIATGAAIAKGVGSAVGAQFMDAVVDYFDLTCVRVYALPMRGASPCLFSLGGVGLDDCVSLTATFTASRMNAAVAEEKRGYYFFRTLMRALKYASRGFAIDFAPWLFAWKMWTKVHEARIASGEISLSRGPLIARLATILDASGVTPRVPDVARSRNAAVDWKLQSAVAALNIACECAEGLPFAPAIALVVAAAAAAIPDRAKLLGGATAKVPRAPPRAPRVKKVSPTVAPDTAAIVEEGASAASSVGDGAAAMPVATSPAPPQKKSGPLAGSVRNDLLPPPTGSFPEGTVFTNPAYQVANVVGTRHDQLKYHASKMPPFHCDVHGKAHSGWLGYMFTKTGACEPICQHASCDEPAELGAHVYVRGWGTKYTFLIPSCQRHNLSDHAHVDVPRENEYNPTLRSVKHLAAGAHYDRFAKEDASWMRLKDSAKLVLMKAVELRGEPTV